MAVQHAVYTLNAIDGAATSNLAITAAAARKVDAFGYNKRKSSRISLHGCAINKDT
jgi:sulfate adenylyltransferase subunit 1 (EFTu-like GTPase family)